MITKDSLITDLPLWNPAQDDNKHLPNQLYYNAHLEKSIQWLGMDGKMNGVVYKQAITDKTIEDFIQTYCHVVPKELYADPPIPCYDKHEMAKIENEIKKEEDQRRQNQREETIIKYEIIKQKLKESGEWQ